ncbi:daptide-type RiPP biosynthesis methyltransferase [Actinacidiphila sp. ITFR-21]|uniref:daptide-type RiPP biosynthesis methyltransferase n=1 Tax=Actinacidiphila sp. ITFR-21 TaxID=3075199 RepID=UPI00288AFF80|nr:daptide-type RiPP biosynthesis methyltransferase [Streptomyces sp. ITFR-21]WNI19655.1 daptide-type RiPP biosynthesis methyltransferase [Streptomyces sp. ITFR-21]
MTLTAGATADVYGPEGAAAYHDLATRDTSEIRDICRAVRATSGPVLELAAGSGRLTLPLLALRRPVTALDLSADLLQLLAERLGELPRSLREACTTVHADMTSFRLPDRFGAVVLGTTSVSLLDPALRPSLYRSVAAHLAPAGRLLLTTRTATADDDLRERLTGASGRGYLLTETRVRPGVRRVVLLPDGAAHALVSEVHEVPADTLAAELAAHGFEITARTVTDEGPGWNTTLIQAEVSGR